MSQTCTDCLFCAVAINNHDIMPTKLNIIGEEAIIVKTEAEENDNDADGKNLNPFFIISTTTTVTVPQSEEFSCSNPNILSEHLLRIFVVRNILDLSESSCVEFLKFNNGESSPGSWFSICSSCNTSVNDCYGLQRKLIKIKWELEKRKDELKEMICQTIQNKDDGQISNLIRLEVLHKRTPDMPMPTSELKGSPDSRISSPKRRRRGRRNQETRKHAKTTATAKTLGLELGASSPNEDIDITAFNPGSMIEQDFVEEEDFVLPASPINDDNDDWIPPPKAKRARFPRNRKKNDNDKMQKRRRKREAVKASKRKRRSQSKPQSPSISKKDADDEDCMFTPEVNAGSGEDDEALSLNKGLKTIKRPQYYRDGKSYVRVLKKVTETPFYCDHCYMIYPYETYLVRHVTMYHPSVPLVPCSICGLQVYSKQLLQLHQEIEHPEIVKPEKSEVDVDCESESTCFHCPKVFSSVLKRDYHIASAHADILLTCKECGFKARKESVLHLHIKRMHTDEKTELCDLCPQTFNSKLNLSYHKTAVHYKELGIDTFKCRFCGSTFGNSISLINHEKFSHLKVKENLCSYCGKGFARNSDLRKHILLHTVPREEQYKKGPFFCEHCGDKFNVRQGLYYHLKRLHSDKFLYRCEKCGKGYCSNTTLHQHQRACKSDGSGENLLDLPPATATSSTSLSHEETEPVVTSQY